MLKKRHFNLEYGLQGILERKKGQASGGTELSVGTVTKLIIAVFCISGLVYFGVQLVGIFLNDTETQQAEASLDRIERKISSLKDKEEGTTTNVLIESPQEWSLVFYEKDVADKDPEWSIPSNCRGEECLCICPGDNPLRGFYSLRNPNPSDAENWKVDSANFRNYFYLSEEGLDNCQSSGICKSVENLDVSSFNILSDNSWLRSNDQDNDFKKFIEKLFLGSDIAFLNAKYIYFDNLPGEISLVKEKDKVRILDSSPKYNLEELKIFLRNYKRDYRPSLRNHVTDECTSWDEGAADELGAIMNVFAEDYLSRKYPDKQIFISFVCSDWESKDKFTFGKTDKKDIKGIHSLKGYYPICNSDNPGEDLDCYLFYSTSK